MSTVTSPPRAVKAGGTCRPHVATKPAAGRWRWAAQPGVGPVTHPGVLIITGEDPKTGKPVSTAYVVRENLDGLCLAGWSLTKPDCTVYDLPADFSTCDCPDHTYHPERPGGCRHMKALRAALAAVGVEVLAAA
jgi:hypothetical protein